MARDCGGYVIHKQQKNIYTDMENLLKASLYVGTYKKYTAGSVSGAWLRLANYDCLNEFLAACRELHKDEATPEFMFQDFEHFEPWYKEDNIEDVWPIINRLKKWSPGYYAKFLHWCDDNGAIPSLETCAEFVRANRVSRANKGKGTTGAANNTDAQPVGELKAIYRQLWRDDTKQYEYMRKNISTAVKLSNGMIVRFEKPRIKTSFCFGYSDFGQGYTEEEANEMCKVAHTKEAFFRENLSDLNLDISTLEKLVENGNHAGGVAYVVNCHANNDRIVAVYTTPYYGEFLQWRAKTPGYRDLLSEEFTREDLRNILEALRSERGKFAKRLEAYWKRYGDSKFRAWSFWADE